MIVTNNVARMSDNNDHNVAWGCLNMAFPNNQKYQHTFSFLSTFIDQDLSLKRAILNIESNTPTKRFKD